MAKKKNKLNKSNSSGWLDNFSEELTINEYQQGGPIKDYRVNNQMVSDNTRNQYNQNTNQFTAEELKAIEKESNKRAADKKKVIDDRKQRVKKSIEAQNKPLSIQNLADLTQATGDKFRLFPNEESFIDDYLNPLVMVGDMASGLGRLPLDIQQGNYGNAALSLATPVTAGALASIGAQNTGEFLNNAFNPIAGTGNLVKDKLGKVVKSNLEKESVKRFLEKPRFAIGRKEYLPETLSFDFQELGGDDFAVILRGPDNAIEANLSLFKSSENWFKPGIISVDPRLQGNRIQDILYQKGLEEAQKRNFVGIRSGDYLIEPEKTLKAHERFETIPLLPDATTKDKNIPIVGMLAHKNKNLYEDFFKQYEALPKEIRAKYSIKDIYNTFKDILPGSSDSKAVSYNYGGEVNEYQKGGKVSPEESTLSKLKKALSLRENLGNLNTEQGYNTPLSQILRTAVGMEGKDLSNESMDPIAREQDAFRMYLGLPSRTGAFEQTGPNKYRIRDYNKLYPDTLLSDEAVRDWGTPYEDGVPDPVNPAFDLYPYDDFVMGKHYITKGKDAKGEYLRYYDKFNLDPTRRANQYIDRNINPRVGKYLKRVTPVLDELESLMFNPFELEDKVYYDPKTKLRSDIILQRNKQRVVPGQPVAIPAEFQSGGDVNNIPSWAYNIKAAEISQNGVPNWWFSTQKLTPERKQKHYNAIINNMIDDGYSLEETPDVLNNIIGYGEDERDRVKYQPVFGFDKGDVEDLQKNYNPNNFKNGGQLGGLDRWFAEKWVDVKTGKECGRQKGEKRKGYPACRPSKRISSETPKTASELSAAEKAKFKREKTSSKRIDYNHKKEDGGKINDDNGYLISNLDNFTPKKIINSNYITTNNMAFPVDANGVILYPNTGDYIFPTNKVIETPIIQEGGKINNDMKKKFKKYQGGGYLNYQDAYKGFGVGPNLTQDNSYYRTAVPGTIENINAQINQPSVFSGINDVLGSVNQGVNQITGLMSNLPMSGGMQGGMENMEAIRNVNYVPMEQNVANNFTQDTQGGTGIMEGAPTVETATPSTGNFNWNLVGNQGSKGILQGLSFMNKNGGYLKKYQSGGMMDMPVGYPEYLHKSNVFAEHVIPVPKVHFSDDTSVFDMGVNLNDLVQMNGGGIGKYQYGGFMNQPRTFNSNSQRMNAAQLAAATENDFMRTKLRNDRQQYEDNKVDWGALNFLKEPTGAYLGMMSNVPIVGNTINTALGDSFLTRTKGYKVGQGAGKTTFGAGKIAGGVALTIAGQPQQGISMIGQGVGDVGSGVGSTVGNLNARSAMEDYNKEGYVSGKRMEKSSQDFGNMMYTATDLFGNIYGGVNKMKGLPSMGGQQGTGGFNFSQLAGMMNQDGGYLYPYQEGGMVFLPEDLEIPKFKKGGLIAKKAREILHDKSVHGKPLTDKQRKYFGYISSQKKSSGGWIDSL